MTYEEIVQTAREILTNNDVSEFQQHLAVQINIVGEGEGAFYIELNDGKVAVEPYEYYDRDVILIATAENFMKIVSGKLNAVLAFTTGKLKIEGSIEKALELQKIIEAIKTKESKTKKIQKE